MRGHEQLIAMRRNGERPGIAFVWCGIDGLQSWRDWHVETPHQAQVEIGEDEPLAGLDLRFFVGMNVVVMGASGRRVAAVAAASLEQGAARVVSAVVQLPAQPGAPAECLSVVDSAEESQ